MVLLHQPGGWFSGSLIPDKHIDWLTGSLIIAALAFFPEKTENCGVNTEPLGFCVAESLAKKGPDAGEAGVQCTGWVSPDQYISCYLELVEVQNSLVKTENTLLQLLHIP